jgi:DNA-binding NarL/FixJ family response regulator
LVKHTLVLFPVSLGDAFRDMAEQLYLSRDTVMHHTQHIYNKTGVSTRAGATLFAMEHGLL